MSFLIQMQTIEEQSPEQNMHLILIQQLSTLIRHPQFCTATIAREEENSIVVCLPRGASTFVRDSRWNLQIKNNQLRIWLRMVQYTGITYLRAESERMKLQLMVLLRFINNKLPIEQEFFVEPLTGLLRYSFIIGWKQYRQKIKGQEALRKLFKYILSQINLYAEVILFCEPQAPETQVGQQMYSQPKGLDSINRYRFLMKGTRKFRQSNMGIMDQIVALKGQLRQNRMDPSYKRQLDQLRVLFQSNIFAYQKMRVGLNNPEDKDLIDCLKHINKAAKGQESRPSESNIVNGIQILRQSDIRSISKQGAHSEIFKGKFIFKIYNTINDQIIADETRWTDGRQNKEQLIFKTCNLQEQSSKNSFMNEICFLNHIRDKQSNYIAKYYLNVKKMQNRSERDVIYMRPYSNNLYHVVRKFQTLTFQKKLSIAFKISKGLCFLGAKSILHRDFKPQNIMMDKSMNPHIIDFGSCAPIFRQNSFQVRQQRLLTTRHFHIYYHEIPQQHAYIRQKLTKQEYNRHPLFDVYSFGRVLSFIFFNRINPPHPDELQSQPYPELLRNILYIIVLCLEYDPDERPTFSEIQNFLGTLKSYLSAHINTFQQKVRSFSEPRLDTDSSL